jgi:hypothetical protein
MRILELVLRRKVTWSEERDDRVPPQSGPPLAGASPQ